MAVSRKVALRQEKVVLVIVVLIIAAVLTVAGVIGFRQQQAAQTRLPDTAPLSVTLGNAPDDKKIVIYTDPVCDKCATYHNETLVPLYNDYVKTGKIKLEIRPISIVTEQSAPLNKLLMCSNEQQGYWQTSKFVYDALTRKNNQTMTVNAATFFNDFPPAEIAQITGLNEQKLGTCLQSDRYDDAIKRADSQAYAANVYSTPTTFVGREDPVRGYSVYPFIRSMIDVNL